MSKGIITVVLHANLCLCAQLLNALIQQVDLEHPHQSTKLDEVSLVHYAI